jgi:hypothetical protein
LTREWPVSGFDWDGVLGRGFSFAPQGVRGYALACDPLRWAEVSD